MFSFTARAEFAARNVLQAAARAERRNLNYFGGYVRKVAYSSMKRGKGVSPAGSPPKAHAGQIKQLLRYAVEPGNVVIGPMLFRGGRKQNLTGPELQEYGGEVDAEVVDPVSGRTRRRRLTYDPHPFMGPAFQAGLKKLDPLWRDSIR